MSTLSTTALNALKLNPPQRVKIKVSPTEGNEFYLTEKQIVQNGCTVDRYVVTGDKISYGTACAAELNFKIKNQKFTYDGTEFDPNDIKFEGAKVKVWCVVDTLPAAEKEIPMGVFTIDEQPRRLSTISLVALDDMVKLDESCSLDVLPSRAEVLSKLKSETGVEVSDNFYKNVLGTVYVNYPKIENCLTSGMEIPLSSDTEEITWRQLMCWFAELVGGSLFINADGELDVLFFPTSSILDITESERYNSDVEENDISVTGITVKLDDGTEQLIGDKAYTYSISGNKLITDTAENINNTDATVKNMANVLDNIFVIYRPFKANIKSFPNLWPMDGVNFCKGNNKYFSIITHVTWTLNGAMSVESAGLNSTRNGYAKTRSLTSAEKAIIERLAKETGEKISDFEQAVIDLNDRVNDTGKGLYSTEVTDENGAKILYTHDMPTLEESTYITMTTSAGFVFTTGTGCWNEGNPVWQYGYTDYGDMVMNTIAARKISTELLTVGKREQTSNLLLNGSFNADEENWNISNEVTEDDMGVQLVPYEKHQFVTENSEKFIRLFLGTKTYPCINSNPISVVPQKKYYVCYKARCSNVSNLPSLEAYVCNSTNTSDQTFSEPSSKLKYFGSDWKQYFFSFTVPSTFCFCILRLSAVAKINSGDYVDFDEIMLVSEDEISEIIPDISDTTNYKYNYIDYFKNNVYISEDEVSVFNGKITIYSDLMGSRPVFLANADGSLRIMGDLKAEGANYDMICANVTCSSDNVDVDSQGLFQVTKGAEIPNTLTDIQTIPYIRFVDEITSDIKKRNIEISSLNDINILSRDSEGNINIQAHQIAAGTAVFNIGSINCNGNLYVTDEGKNFGGDIVECIQYLMLTTGTLGEEINDLWTRINNL